MRALEDLLNEVRDRESRGYLEEAVRAYHAGAFRSAIMAAWTSVAYDVIRKIRQLADDGDGAAGDFVRGLDSAIAAGNTNKLQETERVLLKISHETFEFIDNRELLELNRLHDDRNMCAHPAFVRSSEIFVPTPELVRLHLATATDAVLSKGPTPGKRAIKRFQAEIMRASFPESPDRLKDYLRERYFEPGKNSLRRGLAELIIKGCLAAPTTDGSGPDQKVVRRSALCAHALEQIQPPLLEEALAAVVAKREEGTGLSDDELLRFAANLGDMQPAWQALPDASHSRVYAVLKSADVQRLVDSGVFGCALIAEARESVDARLGELDDIQLAEVIGLSPNARRFGKAAVGALARAATHDAATGAMQTLVLPLALALNPDQVRAVLSCLQDNPQARMATAMPPLFNEFFDATSATFTDCYEDWLTLVQWLADTAPRRDPSGPLGYPDLWVRVTSAGTGS
jgi:hypothetical protein